MANERVRNSSIFAPVARVADITDKCIRVFKADSAADKRASTAANRPTASGYRLPYIYVYTTYMRRRVYHWAAVASTIMREIEQQRKLK